MAIRRNYYKNGGLDRDCAIVFSGDAPLQIYCDLDNVSIGNKGQESTIQLPALRAISEKLGLEELKGVPSLNVAVKRFMDCSVRESYSGTFAHTGFPGIKFHSLPISSRTSGTWERFQRKRQVAVMLAVVDRMAELGIKGEAPPLGINLASTDSGKGAPEVFIPGDFNPYIKEQLEYAQAHGNMSFMRASQINSWLGNNLAVENVVAKGEAATSAAGEATGTAPGAGVAASEGTPPTANRWQQQRPPQGRVNPDGAATFDRGNP
jgi:hypothetical protein